MLAYGEHTQVVKVTDSEAPTGTVDLDDFYGPSHTSCDVTVTLPAPDLDDNCSPDGDLGYAVSVHGPVPPFIDACAITAIEDIPQLVVDAVVAPTGANTYTFHGNDDCGIYLAVYQIYDCCGNSSYIVACFEVGDDIPPVAICDQNSQLTLTYGPNPATTPGVHADGWATIHWTSLDDGSYDNCELKDIRIAKGEFGPWREELTFGCDEKGDNKVWLRVRDDKNNESKCWVTVIVEDKAPPQMDCPPDATVFCGDDISPAALGEPDVRDECYFDLEYNDNSDLYCGV